MYRIAHTPRHREQRFMAAAPERSRRLHNFTLPELKWGNQRLLRCVTVNNRNGDSRRSSAPVVESDGTNRRRVPPELIRRRSPVRVPESFKKSSLLKPFDDGGDGNGIDAVREKLMNDLRVAADRMKVSILEEKELEESSSAARPWNLRTRRAACKAPEESPNGGGGTGGGNSRNDERQQRNNGYTPPLRPENPMTTAKSSRLRGLAAASAAMAATEHSTERRDQEPLRTKVPIPLSRSEIERDFLVMAGIKPPRRPKKRPKIVQRQVDACFPGLWLTEITPEKYKVPDAPESTKS